MAALTFPNSQFLLVQDTLLAALEAQAERYFAQDPVTSSMKPRQFGEPLAQRAAAHLGPRWESLQSESSSSEVHT